MEDQDTDSCEVIGNQSGIIPEEIVPQNDSSDVAPRWAGRNAAKWRTPLSISKALANIGTTTSSQDDAKSVKYPPITSVPLLAAPPARVSPNSRPVSPNSRPRAKPTEASPTQSADLLSQPSTPGAPALTSSFKAKKKKTKELTRGKAKPPVVLARPDDLDKSPRLGEMASADSTSRALGRSLSPATMAAYTIPLDEGLRMLGSPYLTVLPVDNFSARPTAATESTYEPQGNHPSFSSRDEGTQIACSPQTELEALRAEYSILQNRLDSMIQRNTALESKQAARSVSSNRASSAKTPRPPIARAFSDNLERARVFKGIMTSMPFKAVALVALLFALFGSALFTLSDFPDDPGNAILDAIMFIIMIFFCFEIVGTWQFQKPYRLSFFFWMDVAGTISMIFEISWFLKNKGESNSVLLRAARTAKLGARIGRLFKIQKFFLMSDVGDDESTGSKAKVLSRNLMLTLSTKVSILTIVLVFMVPVFEFPLYPSEDLSMKLWSQRLEEIYQWELNATPTNIFEVSLLHMQRFYNEEDYKPFRIEGYQSALSMEGVDKQLQGQHQLQGKAPNRKTSERYAEVLNCRLHRTGCNGAAKAKIHFDFTVPNQFQAGMEISLVLFMMVVMIMMSFEIMRSVETVLVRPLERMLSVIRAHATKLLEQVAGLNLGDGDELEEQKSNEVEVLETVLSKLARLVELHLSKNVIQQSELANMDESGMAIMEMLDVKVVDANATRVFGSMGTMHPMNENAIHMEAELDTWDVDVLNMTAEHIPEVVHHIFFSSHLGVGSLFVDKSVFNSFLRVVKVSYNDNPYHCYAHAIDILHTVYRYCTLISCSQWATPIEQYAILIAALCHDVGHCGKTNPFLVETGHELALRYNDKSPLENMHCAKLFQICGDPDTDAFRKASVQMRKEARAICIASILSTDNTQHFNLVKDLAQVYEMNSETCNEQAKQGAFSQTYLSEVLHKEKQLWFDLLLHMADVSNPVKPFHICRAWAFRVLDEFFAQGDEEKQLGITVGMLNDRDKVNRPESQHSFINFLVSPLVLRAVEIFPQIHVVYVQLGLNVESWCKEWAKDSNPPQEEIDKKLVDVQRLKASAERLKLRAVDIAPSSAKRSSVSSTASLSRTMRIFEKMRVKSRKTEVSP